LAPRQAPTPAFWFARARTRWYNTDCYGIHKVACARASTAWMGRLDRLEFSNLPHDFAETLELVFVGITIVVSMAILVLFGRWWQK